MSVLRRRTRDRRGTSSRSATATAKARETRPKHVAAPPSPKSSLKRVAAPPVPESLVIVTGLSGSGKSYVFKCLEDMGYFCVDNLPLPLIEPLLSQVTAPRVGIILDVRNPDFAPRFLASAGFSICSQTATLKPARISLAR